MFRINVSLEKELATLDKEVRFEIKSKFCV